MNKTEIETYILEMVEFSSKNYTKLNHIGVLGGQSGVALFQFYSAKYFDNDSFSNNGVEILSSCFDKINDGYNLPTYCNGITGFSWALQFLFDKSFIDIDLDETLAPFDEYLLKSMRLDFSKKNYDFLHGALGYAFYFLKRYNKTQNNTLKRNYFNNLNEVITYFSNTAIIRGDSLIWESIIDPAKNNIGINFSLSHGMSSIINFLSRTAKIDPLKEESTKLLRGAIKSILKFKSGSPESTLSLFPSYIEADKMIQYNSRVAWCYGDLGIALSLYKAGISIEDEEIITEAIKIAKRTSKRLRKETAVYDAGLCHGSFGIHQIYRNFNSYFDKSLLDFWVKDGLKYSVSGKYGLFGKYNAQSKEYTNELNLLEGISGIGLSLIDFVSESTSDWDECLLLGK